MAGSAEFLTKCTNVIQKGMSLSRPVTEEKFRQICGQAGLDARDVILVAIAGKLGDFIPEYIKGDLLPFFMPDGDSKIVDDLLYPDD